MRTQIQSYNISRNFPSISVSAARLGNNRSSYVFSGLIISKRYRHRAATAKTRLNDSKSLASAFYNAGTRVKHKPYIHRPSQSYASYRDNF